MKSLRNKNRENRGAVLLETTVILGFVLFVLSGLHLKLIRQAKAKIQNPVPSRMKYDGEVLWKPSG